MPKNSKRRIPETVLASMVAVSCNAHASSWAPPYTGADTVGSVLEERFNELLKQCKVTVPLRKTTKGILGESLSDPISAIPASLQGGALPLSSQWLQVKQLSAARLFAYLYKEAEQTSTFVDDASMNLSEAEFADDAAEFLVKGGVDVVYKQTCGTVVSAAANFSTDWSMPGAAMSAALQSDFNDNSQNVFLLTSGELHSPLAALIESDNPYKKLRGNLVLWQWYAGGGTGQVSYLADLKTVALYEYSATNNRINGAVKLKGSGGITGAAAAGSIDESLSSELTYKIAQSRTLILKPPAAKVPWGTFKAAPSIEEIIRVAGRAIGQPRVTTSVISPGVENVHSQFFPGLQAKCDPNLWDIRYPLGTDVAKGAFSIKAAHAVKDQSSQLGGCEFQIGFVPAAAVDSASLKFNLKYQMPAAGKYIELPAGQIDLSVSAAPYITRVTDNRRWQTLSTTNNPDGSTDSNMQWTIKYTLDEDDDDKTIGKNPGIASVSLVCPGELKPFITKEALYNSGTQQLILTLRATISSTANLDVDGKTAPIQCSLVGTADFVMQKPVGAHRIQKQPVGQEVVLLYPSPNPKQAAPTPAIGQAAAAPLSGGH